MLSAKNMGQNISWVIFATYAFLVRIELNLKKPVLQAWLVLKKIPACNFCFPLYVLLKGSDRLREWNSTKVAWPVKINGTYWVTGSPLWLEFLSEWGKNQNENFEHHPPKTLKNRTLNIFSNIFVTIPIEITLRTYLFQ